MFYCIKIFRFAFLIFFINSKFALSDDNFCTNKQKYYNAILNEVSKNNPEVINNLPECLKLDRKLMFKTILIDPKQFQNTSDILHQDKVFIKRAVKASPEVLKYCAPEIKSDQYFMEDLIYINRDTLKYSSWSLLDNKSFMKKMVDLDSENYRFASDRLKSMTEFAEIALHDNGDLLEFATPNVKSSKEYVKIAINSSRNAIKYAHQAIASDPEFIKLATNSNPIPSKELIEKYLEENYYVNHPKKYLGKIIANQGKFFKENILINRNYIVKWNKKFNIDKIQFGEFEEEWKLFPIKNRNFNYIWRDELKSYNELSEKIEKFFRKRRITNETIDNLSLTYLWEIKKDPLTIAFNLYDFYPATDIDFSSDFSNLSSLTAIAQYRDNKWVISVIEVIFNREIKIDPLFKNGHKKYILWDLYKSKNDDSNPKLIYKVEDIVGDYFEIYEEQNNGKYRLVYSSKKIHYF